jgi:hypothetical protein
MERAGEWGIVGRQRVEAMVETLASLGSRGESLAEVAHDARNMVTALGLYCDLLEEPGVLALPFAHYSHELRLVAAASRRLVEKLVALDGQADGGAETHGVSILGSDLGAGLGPAGLVPQALVPQALVPQALVPQAVISTGVAEPGLGAGGWPAAAGGEALGSEVGDTCAAKTLTAGAGPQGGSENDPGGPESSGAAHGHPDEEENRVAGIEFDRENGRNPGVNLEGNGAGSRDQTAGQRAAWGGEARFSPGRERGRNWETLLSAPVDNLAAEVLANRNLLSALAGPGIAVTVDAEGGARPVRLTAEDLTRLLVNLVKNAAEAIPAATGPGHIQISLRESAPSNGAPASLLLAIEDNGPGIPQEALARVFDSGFTTHARNSTLGGGWPVLHRGLGLAIARSLVEAAGGRITAANRELGGACIALELPVRAA